MMGGMLAAPMIFGKTAFAEEKAPSFRILAKGLRFPEGPAVLPDGNLVVVEIGGGCLTRVGLNGKVGVVADLGGGPNGSSVGPDGAVYVCNNGGLNFSPVFAPTLAEPGSIQRVDLKTGKFNTLYGEAGGQKLIRPNDLVFDPYGGFWFSDAGKGDQPGCVCWAKADGSEIRRVIEPLIAPNGIAFSPDRRILYVVHAPSSVSAYEVTGPGQLASQAGVPRSRIVAQSAAGLGWDSMAVEADGNLVIGTLRYPTLKLPQIIAIPEDQRQGGGLTVISPDGMTQHLVSMPDPQTTNLAFGGPDMKTAYVTFSSMGILAAVEWRWPGLKLLNKA
jgi:gluconolactonase